MNLFYKIFILQHVEIFSKELLIADELGDECSSGDVCTTGSCRNGKCSCTSGLVAYRKNLCVNMSGKWT